MARTGIRNIETRVAFVDAVLDLRKGWAAPGLDAGGRAAAVVKAANAALGKYGVPPMRLDLAGQSSPFAAEFGQGEWSIQLDERAFSGTKAPANAELAELVDSVYHESRHAEQWFLAARSRLGEGWSTDDLVRFGLKRSVAVAAAFLSLPKGSPEEGLAAKLADCLLTKAGVERILETQRDLDTLRDGSTAGAKEKQEAFDRLKAKGYLRGTYDPGALGYYAHKAYQSQLPEADAWDTGRLAAELFQRLAHMKPLPPVPQKTPVLVK